MKNKIKEKKSLNNEVENINIDNWNIDIKDIKPKLRQVILETDGNSIKLVKAEVTSMIELQAILSMMLEALKKQ